MITEHDLQEAIEETQGKRDPNANDCIKLAAFYTIRNELFGSADSQPAPMMSYAARPTGNTIDYDSGTEFSRVINGRQAQQVFAVLDELMGILSAINPRLYNATLDKIEQ